jgi:hypothetical protein
MKTGFARVVLLFLFFAGLGAGPALGTAITSFQSGLWTNPASWTPAQVPASTNDVTIATGHTITIATNTSVTIASLTILTNGVLTHLNNYTSELYKVILNIAGGLTIDAGGAINADAKGYALQNGPGYAGGNSGSGYGGIGGIRNAAKPGTTYGSITAPTNIGSGGGYAGNQYGGGAVILTVGGASTVNGTISAIASNLTMPTYDAGSGGSIFLTTAALTGNGTLVAKGGNANNNSSGGGGRIAVILTNSMDFGTVGMQAYAGLNGAGNSGGGAGGTIYLQHTNHTPNQGKLIVDYNKNCPGADPRPVTLQNGAAASSYAFSEIVLTNGGVYALDTNDTLTLPSVTTVRGDPTAFNDGLYLQGGTLNVPSPFSMSSTYFIGISASNATFNPSPSLTIRTNELFIVNAPFILPCPLTIEMGGVLTHITNSTAETYKMDLTVQGNLNVQTGGQVTADGRGYQEGVGPGKAVTYAHTGGSYGGFGGLRYTTCTNGPTYGSIVAPTNMGSGGGNGGAYGGGALRLNVTGTTTVNGVISANSRNEMMSGAGGSVYLTTGALEGNGFIRANSPAGTWALGGGGRVAVILTNGNDFGSVSIQASAGTGSGGTYMYGGAGTVYLQTLLQGAGNGTLWINATNLPVANATAIGTNMADTVVGTVIITNGAVLLIESNRTLTVNGSWLNRSRPVNGSTTNWTVCFTSAPNSKVIFAGTNDAIAAGTNIFWNLTCSNALKTVRFMSGSTNRVNGTLALGGGTTFKSATDGAWWYLSLAPGGSQQIGLVTVRDGNAADGQTLYPQKFSVNQGNNVNWSFLKLTGAVIQIR